jgi:hypothetical protein
MADARAARRWSALCTICLAVAGVARGQRAQPGDPAGAARHRTRPHFVRLFDGRTLKGWIQVPPNSWTVKDGAIASLGAGRGFIYTMHNYSSYRLMFTARHISGLPHMNHQMCFLVFCTRPAPGQKPLDALGGIQFQPPNGGHWDYRPGHNNVGAGEFTELPHRKFDPSQWFRVEILVNGAAGTARMAVAQPLGRKAVEVLDFKNPAAGKTGPIAFQMHNKGLLDEYKDVVIEIAPADHHLITTK